MRLISDTFSGGLGFSFREDRRYYRVRRAIDIIVSTMAMVISFPIVLGSAVAIVVENPGNPIFVQTRVGRFGKLFNLYKLRTMRIDMCGDAPSPTQSQDMRITRVGRVLRRLSFDELPQFFNVFLGEMTLVGPRPEMPFLVKRYAPWQQLRHLVTPGITGLWQVECRSSIPLHAPEATALDLQYIQSSSTFTDGRIIVRTLRAIVSQHGAF